MKEVEGLIDYYASFEKAITSFKNLLNPEKRYRMLNLLEPLNYDYYYIEDILNSDCWHAFKTQKPSILKTTKSIRLFEAIYPANRKYEPLINISTLWPQGIYKFVLKDFDLARYLFRYLERDFGDALTIFLIEKNNPEIKKMKLEKILASGLVSDEMAEKCSLFLERHINNKYKLDIAFKIKSSGDYSIESTSYWHRFAEIDGFIPFARVSDVPSID